jgi:hypothetical protein
MNRSKGRLLVAALAVSAALAMSAGSAIAEEGQGQQEGYWSQAGLGLGSMLTNLVYMPCKITYATLGAITGGLTYALTGGSYDTAESVWVASLGGTYVVTPDMLAGKRAVEFTGTPEVRTASTTEHPSPIAESGGSSDSTQTPAIGEGYAHDGF